MSATNKRRVPLQTSTHELQFSSIEVDYQPSPETVAGFIQTMAEKVNDLLSAAHWKAAEIIHAADR